MKKLILILLFIIFDTPLTGQQETPQVDPRIAVFGGAPKDFETFVKHVTTVPMGTGPTSEQNELIAYAHYQIAKIGAWSVRKNWRFEQKINPQTNQVFDAPAPLEAYQPDVNPYAEYADMILQAYPGVQKMLEMPAPAPAACPPAPACPASTPAPTVETTPAPTATPEMEKTPLGLPKATDTNVAPKAPNPADLLPAGIALKQAQKDFIIGRNPAVQIVDTNARIKEAYQTIAGLFKDDKIKVLNNDGTGTGTIFSMTGQEGEQVAGPEVLLPLITGIWEISGKQKSGKRQLENSNVKKPIYSFKSNPSIPKMTPAELGVFNRICKAFIWGVLGFQVGTKKEILESMGFELRPSAEMYTQLKLVNNSTILSKFVPVFYKATEFFFKEGNEVEGNTDKNPDFIASREKMKEVLLDILDKGLGLSDADYVTLNVMLTPGAG